MQLAVIIISVLWVLDRLDPKDAPPLQVGARSPVKAKRWLAALSAGRAPNSSSLCRYAHSRRIGR